MARLYQTSLEINATTVTMEESASSNGTSMSSITTAGVVSGTRALQMSPATAIAVNRRYHVLSANSSLIGYAKVHFRIPTGGNPSALSQCLVFLNAANTVMGSLQVSTLGAIGLYDSAGTQIGSSTTLAADTTYCIEMMCDATTTPGALAFRVNGTTIASGANAVQGQWSRVTIGAHVAGGTFTFIYDDLIVNSSSGLVDNTWVGTTERLFFFMPNAAGDSNQWLTHTGGAGSATNWQEVITNPPGTTAFVESNTLNNLDLYNVTDPTGVIGASDTVTNVILNARAADVVADAVTAYKTVIEKTASGTQALSTASFIPNGTTFITNGSTANGPFNAQLLNLDPDGAAWTQSTISSMQVGVKLTAAGTNMVKVNGIWGYVGYIPVTSEQPSLMMLGVG